MQPAIFQTGEDHEIGFALVEVFFSLGERENIEDSLPICFFFNNFGKGANLLHDFFTALETAQFHLLKTIFAENGRQLNPYAPEGFPKSFDGAEAIYRQYSGLTATFGKMRFPRQIFATEDPNFFFVIFKGTIEIKAGGVYENDYLGTFRLQDGKIAEYTEYFNQMVMAKAFGIKLI